MSVFDARVEAKSLRFRADIYRMDGHEALAQKLEEQACAMDELANDIEVGRRRAIRREIGIVHQIINGLQCK